LDLNSAIEAEARASNSVLPPQPGLAELAANRSEQFTEWLAGELETGLRIASRVVVNVRKPRHGTRPAPIVAIPDRVAYRSIVDRVLAGDGPLARSRTDYLAFIRGPVDYVKQKSVDSGLRTLGLLLNDDEIQYVVKSDLSAFYEYVDHGILGRLLVARSRDTELVQCLTDFLGELEGRSYGVPQMFDASDRLSEVYAQLIQDQLSRRGFLAWRFNDDAIEALSEEARSLGLVINEQKTTSPRFVNYAMATLGVDSIDDEIPAEEEDEVEAAVADYTETFGDPDEAVALIGQAVAGENGWTLGDLNAELVARLRRAFWSVVRAEDERALPALVPMAIYVPSLTPVLCRYATVVAQERPEEVASVIDVVVRSVSLGGWQRLWFANLLRTAELLRNESGSDLAARIAFVEGCASDDRHPVARAESILALAPTGRLSVQSIAESLVTQPRALASWYVIAAAQTASTDRDEKVLRGISGTDPLFGMILDSVL
jgi:hypothetical protein